MGNRSSRIPSAEYTNSPGVPTISGPTPLKGDKTPVETNTGVHRRATAHAASHNNLSPPVQTHRRARSAFAGTPRDSQLLPPPPYQEALFVPGSHNASGASLHAPPEQTNNPFRRSRTVSFGGQPLTESSAAGLQTPQAAGPASRAPQRAAEQERIQYLRQPMRQRTYENALETLRRYDTVLIVDDSSSMQRAGRWQEARSALAALAQIAGEYDADGIDVYFLNNRKQGNGVKDASQIQRLFDSVRPNGLTPIGDTLDRLLGAYIDKLESAKNIGTEGNIRPVNFIVLTDGAPTDEPADVIIAAARRLDKGNFMLSQLGIQFVQIGDDEYATEFLRQLDDDIAVDKGVRDIVDTTPYLGSKVNAEVIIKILLGGINRRVDRRGGASVM